MPLRLNLLHLYLLHLLPMKPPMPPSSRMPSCLYESLSSCVHSHPKSAGSTVNGLRSPSGRSLLCKSERDFVAALSAHSKVSKSTRISFSTRMWLEQNALQKIELAHTGPIFKLHCYFSSGTRCARCNPSLDHWSTTAPST